MVEMSENAEAIGVLVATIGAGITGFLAATPLPAEWKVPLIGVSGTVTAALLAYWKAKVNKPV